MTNKETYYHGTGRRKTTVARVRLYPGTGPAVVNDKPLAEMLPILAHQHRATQPLTVVEASDRFRIQAKVAGGGVSAWADAIAHGVARALVAADPEYRKTLRKNGLLTRDPREKERKKYGLKRARKAPQYTKR
jgi:small subunit ribosomal protein S9